MSRLPILLSGFGALAVMGLVRSASADEFSVIETSAVGIEQQAMGLRKQYLGGGFAGKHHAEERLIDGENYYRLKDYQRAAIVFMDIIEQYPNHAAYPDALYYFADSLFLSRDFYGARTWFQKFLQEGNKTGFGRFRPKVIARLVEIAIHLNDYKGVEQYFDMLGQQLDAEALYVKGKYLYFKGDYAKAREAFGLVTGQRLLSLKAAYFIGAAFTKEERFDDAIQVFKTAATEAKPPLTPDEQEIVDLLNLGLGRLLYEKDFVENASFAYQKVGRYSPYYDVALYEAAAVQMRAGNTIMAERILEVLTLAMPQSKYIPRAKLLRGNLLLRAGRYDEAEKVFLQAIDEFEPVQVQMDKVLGEEAGAGEFFDTLTARGLDTLDADSMVPGDIAKWVGDAPEVKRAFTVTEDLGKAGEYTRESERLLRLIGAVVDGASPVNAVPTLRSAKRQEQKLMNQLGELSLRLIKAVEAQGGDLGPLSAKRQALAKSVAALPTSDGQFQKRERKAKLVFVRMRKELARQEVMLDKLMATIVALERFLEKDEYTADVTADALEGYRQELARHKDGVAVKLAELQSLRDDIDRALYQVGVGDERDRNDAETLSAVTELLNQVQAAIAGSAVFQRSQTAFSALAKARRTVSALSNAVDDAAEAQIASMRQQLARERERVKQYRSELSLLNDEAREVVSGVARDNFSTIRQRFHELLLKADVGIIDIAWMRKEEHKLRGVRLSKERTGEIQMLDEEFSGVNRSQQVSSASQ